MISMCSPLRRLISCKQGKKKSQKIYSGETGPNLGQVIKMNITCKGQMGVMCPQVCYSEEGHNILSEVFWPRMNKQKLVTRKHRTNAKL